MSEYDNTNSGALFKNDKDGNEKRPDYTGKLDVEGKEYRLAAWIRDGRRGKFMSLKLSEPNSSNGGSSPQGAGGSGPSGPMDEDVPFAK